MTTGNAGRNSGHSDDTVNWKRNTVASLAILPVTKVSHSYLAVRDSYTWFDRYRSKEWCERTGFIRTQRGWRYHYTRQTGCHFDQSVAHGTVIAVIGHHKNDYAKILIFLPGVSCVPDNSKIRQTIVIYSPFWRMVLDSLSGETTQEILHCPPYEGIGREEAADVRKQGFIRRASSTCVNT